MKGMKLCSNPSICISKTECKHNNFRWYLTVLFLAAFCCLHDHLSVFLLNVIKFGTVLHRSMNLMLMGDGGGSITPLVNPMYYMERILHQTCQLLSKNESILSLRVSKKVLRNFDNLSLFNT